MVGDRVTTDIELCYLALVRVKAEKLFNSAVTHFAIGQVYLLKSVIIMD